MTRPKAADGNTLSDGSWSIYDAQAFTVGKSLIKHSLKSFPSSATVVGKCGVTGRTAYDEQSPREAVWADGVNCFTCTTR